MPEGEEVAIKEFAEGEEIIAAAEEEEKYTLIDAFKLLIRNKYYLMICACYILMQIYSATLNMGIYYMTYVLKNANLLGVFSWFINIPMIIGLLFTPALVAKWGGMYKLNLTGYTLGTLGRLGVVIAGYLGSVPLMLACTAIAAIGMSPLQGDMNALIAAGETETDAQVFDLGDLSVAEFVVCKNAMMRKVTTGTRVMAYLKCHEREVLAAADPEKYQQRPGNGANFKSKHHAVSRETAWDKGWSAKEIAGRIGVSKQDVLAGIELLKEVSGETESVQQQGKYVQLDLFETMDSVMHGETPIRRWKAAASGKVSKVGGKAAADYVGIGARTMVSLIGLFENWQTVPMESRGPIVERFKLALEAAPEDFRAVIKDWMLLTEATLPGKGKGKRR